MSAAKTAIPAAAVAGGAITGWLTGGDVAVVCGLGVLVAAANGYSKSYSP
jgi:hypothetical protein